MNIGLSKIFASVANATRPAAAPVRAAQGHVQAANIPAAPPPAAAGAGAAPADLGKAIEAIKAWLPEPVRTNLSFRVDEDIDRVVVTVRDEETGTIVRQIPDDVVIRVARNLQDFNSSSNNGGLFDEVA